MIVVLCSLKEREEQLTSLEAGLIQLREELETVKRAQAEETQNRYCLYIYMMHVYISKLQNIKKMYINLMYVSM